MRKIKRVFCLTVCYVGLMLPVFSQMQGGVDRSWYNVDTHEYIISSAEQLKALSELVDAGESFAGKTVYLRNNIDASHSLWFPIGTLLKPFSGTFDGNGYCITVGNMHSGELGGVFGFVASATIRNLAVSVVGDLSGIQTVGSVVAHVDSSSVIENCSHVSVLKAVNVPVVGGIAGISEGKIRSCCNKGDIVSVNADVNVLGGIVGVSAGIVLHSYNESLIMGTNVCAGIVGKDMADGQTSQIVKCHNSGKVSARSSGADNVYDVVAGGIGGMLNNTNISECYNEGKVSSYSYKNIGENFEFHAYSGGLLGMGYGNILTSYNMGDVVARYLSDVSGVLYVYSGGLVGFDMGSFASSSYSYSYNAGYVYAFGQGANMAYLNYGGLMGDFSSFMPQMKCCYSILDWCRGESLSDGNSILYPKNVGVQVSAEQLCSPSFLHSDKGITGLNDNYSFLLDTDGYNKGYPVLLDVQTVGISRTAEDGVMLKGATKVSGHKGFYYWIKGLEEYVAEIDASSDFEYLLGNLQRGQDYFFQAYVKLDDGTVLKGDVVSWHIPDRP